MKPARTYLEIMLEAALKAGEATLQYYDDPGVIMKSDQSPLTKADLESDRIISEYLAKTNLPILSEENQSIPYSARKNWTSFWLVDPLDGTKEFINKRLEYTVNIALIENEKPIAGVVYAPALKLLYYAHQDVGAFRKVLKAGTFEIKNILLTSDPVSIGKLPGELRVVASKSHLSPETVTFIQTLKRLTPVGEMKSIGSSLKLCMVAEGNADIYPRLGPTMEWDTAASHAIVNSAGGMVVKASDLSLLSYNKPDLLNPHFIVFRPELLDIVRIITNKD